LPELPPEKLQAFGKAVKAARALKGMTLDQAAFKCLGRDNAKGYFSQIENGKRQITARTAGKIITALEMDAALLEPFLGEDEIAEDEVTKADTDAEKLIVKAQADNTGAVTGERLLIDLAYEFAEGSYNDLFTAYKGLRAALEAAKELKAQGNLPQNSSSQLDEVLRRVSELNEDGDRDGAAEFLAAEEKRLDAETEALFNAQLKQDRVRNRPDLAAKRLYKNTARKAHQAGRKRFVAIDDLVYEWIEDGDKSGDMFSLQVALELAKTSKSAASGTHAEMALYRLGWCYFRLAERSPKEGLLRAAENTFRAGLQKSNKTTEPLAWSANQYGLGVVLKEIGRRNRDDAVLRKSVSASRACVEIGERHDSTENGKRLSGLGTALLTLGQWNVADLALAPLLGKALARFLGIPNSTLRR
jgi:transcriptional regulator with XRE-family HTH domain